MKRVNNRKQRMLHELQTVCTHDDRRGDILDVVAQLEVTVSLRPQFTHRSEGNDEQN